MGSVAFGLNLQGAVLDSAREMALHALFYLVQHLQGVPVTVAFLGDNYMG